MNTSQKLITAIILFLFISLSFLAYSETKQRNYSYSQSWWALYFNDPKNQDMSFTIENHSSEKNFAWEVYLDKNSIHKGDIEIGTGEKRTIPAVASDVSGRKITIKVTSAKTTKEIYKTLN